MSKNYTYVSASESVSVGTGKVGDRINRIVVIPTGVGSGTVSIKDGSDDAIVLYTSSMSTTPVSLELGIQSGELNGWTVITGEGLSVIVIGEW